MILHIHACRWLYWTDWGEVAKIERISMAGEIDSRQTLHETGLTWPNALTVDYSMQTLYWADAQLNKIEMSGVDGSNRTLLTSSMVLHPFALTYHNGALYWSDWQTDQIFTTNVATPNSVSVLVPTLGTEPMGLEVVTTARQPISKSTRIGTSIFISLYFSRTIFFLNWPSTMKWFYPNT